MAAPAAVALAEVRVPAASGVVPVPEASEVRIIIRPTSTVPISVGAGDGVVLAVTMAEAADVSAQ